MAITTSVDKGHRISSISMHCETLEDTLRLCQFFIDARRAAETPSSKIFFTALIDQLEACLPMVDSFDELPAGQNESPLQRDMREANHKSFTRMHNIEKGAILHSELEPDVMIEIIEDLPKEGEHVEMPCTNRDQGEFVVQVCMSGTNEVVSETEPFKCKVAAERHAEVLRSSEASADYVVRVRDIDE